MTAAKTLVGARRMKTDLCTENVVVHTNFANRSHSNSPILGRHTVIASSTTNRFWFIYYLE